MMRFTLDARPVVASTTSLRPAGPPPPLPAVFTSSNADRDFASTPTGPPLVRRGRSRTPPRSVPISESVDVGDNGHAQYRIDAGVEIDTNTGNGAILVDNEVDAVAGADTNIMSVVDAGIDALFRELDDVQSTLVDAGDPRLLGATSVLDVRLRSHIGVHLEITTTATSGSAAGRVPTPLGGPLPAPMVELDSDFVSDTACSRFSSHGDT